MMSLSSNALRLAGREGGPVTEVLPPKSSWKISAKLFCLLSPSPGKPISPSPPHSAVPLVFSLSTSLSCFLMLKPGGVENIDLPPFSSVLFTFLLSPIPPRTEAPPLSLC
ncbi:hypothetical protein V8G54_023612 [Vigna mungo]|uniref:Uncharacterized protein n=1 Tax=Vigna mungo TaxID=3915 RepID=A0AAQ3RSP3_VIGMU